MSTNMKPADELLMVRQKIKDAQKREAEIKDAMKAGKVSTVGDFAIARFVKRKTKRFDRKAAEAKVGSLAEFDVVGETHALMIDELDTEVLEG